MDDFRKRIVVNQNISTVDLRSISSMPSFPHNFFRYYFNLQFFFSVEEVMQFYNYATRVLLDDLSNIIRYFLSHVLAPITVVVLCKISKCKMYFLGGEKILSLKEMTNMRLISTLAGLQMEAAHGVIWSLIRICCEQLKTLGSRCHWAFGSMLEMSFPRLVVVKKSDLSVMHRHLCIV